VEEKNKDVVRLKVDRFSIISEHIIPFFSRYPLQSNKIKDYLDFCKACIIIRAKSHLTEKGLKELRLIKSGMNTGRKY